MNYTKEELESLHLCLYDILKEIRRVCDILNIKFIMLGGSAIGVYYWDGIIPFDDDIDIGMKRDDFEQFLKEAPQLLDDKYFLQWCGSEKHYHLFFAKVRRNGTLFVEENLQDQDIHQGIFIDILPLDNIPDSTQWRFVQRKLANIANDCFVAKEIWRYPWLGKCQVAEPLKASWLNCLFVRMISVLFSKKAIYRVLHFFQTFYNNKPTHYCNTVPYYCDYISAEDISNLQEVKFGDLRVWVPHHLEDYLHRHYPILKKYLSEEEQQQYKNHRPIKLELPSVYVNPSQMNSVLSPRLPKISVITVVFNRVETIGKTIENTLSQTYPNLECVVVDGASTDGTMEIVKSYADRIRWISEPDNGIYDAMMKGARMATGEWVIFRNTGDYFYSNHVIKDIFENYEDKGEDFITGRVRYFVNHYYIDVDDFDDYPKKSYFESIPAHPSTFIRRATQLANPYNLKYKQDADRYFFMTLLRNGGTYYKTPCIVALFDKRTGSTTDHYDVTLQERIEIYYLLKAPQECIDNLKAKLQHWTKVRNRKKWFLWRLFYKCSRWYYGYYKGGWKRYRDFRTIFG